MTCSRAVGLAVGFAADRALGDPARWHPVAGFGSLAGALERRAWADARPRGAAYAVVLVGATTGAGVAVERATRERPVAHALATAVATWVVLGGTSLGREAGAVDDLLRAGRLDDARQRLTHLVGRDTRVLDADGVARAAVESVAENTSDAVVAPLVYAAAAGIPGLLVYRAINTLDAMVGYRSERYLRFGWAAARLDDLANLVPARLTCALAAVLAPTAAGSTRAAARAWRQDGAGHESPNAGPVKAAFAGALGVRLGGPVRYPHGLVERPWIGGGRDPEVADVRRAVRLSRAVGLVGLAFAVAARVAVPRRTRGGSR